MLFSISQIKRFKFVATRLWNYLTLYFLKPFDAVNDTLTASLLTRLDWNGEVVELGAGDGVFSYVMHGGSFPLWFDRYLLTDLSKNDIYDTHRKDVLPATRHVAFPNVILAIDAKESHVRKIREIHFAKSALLARYEALPIREKSVSKIFYYTPHGLRSHQDALREAARILKYGGSLLILLYDSAFLPSFICHRLSTALPGRLGAYFSQLNSGRYEEISQLARPPKEWESLFSELGFAIEAKHVGLSTLAWKAYDIQTRPLLKFLIKLFGRMPTHVRTALKLTWMILCYPIVLIFYLLYSNEYLRIDRTNCYIAYQLKKTIDAGS